jgi:alpha-L-arabinofuranosidase
VVPSSFGVGLGWTGENGTVLGYLKNDADYLSLHMYVGNPQNDYGDFVASSMELASRLKTAEGIIDAALSGVRNRKIYIAWDEWNVWYRARGERERGRRILEEHYNLEDALVVATFLNTFVNHAHIVKIANMAQLVNVIAPIFTNENGLFLQTIYYPLQLFASNTRGKALELFVDGPRYNSRRFDDIPYLDISAGYDNGNLVVNVVNRHKDQAIQTEFELEDKQFSGAVGAIEVNGPDIKAENNFDDAPVQPGQRPVAAQGKMLRYSFPPHSFTMIRAKLA